MRPTGLCPYLGPQRSGQYFVLFFGSGLGKVCLTFNPQNDTDLVGTINTYFNIKQADSGYAAWPSSCHW